jgi:hypothetical protein
VNHPVSQLKFRRFLTEDNRVERSWHATPRFPEPRLDSETDLKGSRTYFTDTGLSKFVARVALNSRRRELDGRGIAPHSPRPSSPPGTP